MYCEWSGGDRVVPKTTTGELNEALSERRITRIELRVRLTERLSRSRQDNRFG